MVNISTWKGPPQVSPKSLAQVRQQPHSSRVYMPEGQHTGVLKICLFVYLFFYLFVCHLNHLAREGSTGAGEGEGDWEAGEEKLKRKKFKTFDAECRQEVIFLSLFFCKVFQPTTAFTTVTACDKDGIEEQ